MQKTIILLSLSLFFLSCEEYDFKTVNHPPDIPENPSPSHGATGVSTAPTLSWNASADPDGDAITYDVYFDTIYLPSLISSNQTVTSIGRNWLYNGTTYFWKIVAKDNKGTETSGPVWNFTTATIHEPILSSPSNGATNVNLNPTFTWNASSGATSYRLQVSTNSGFSTTVIDHFNIPTTSYTASGLSNNTTYYWRASATNAGGTSSYSNVWSFTTASLPAPTLSSPSNGATNVNLNPTFTWNASSGATSYRLQVSTNSGFSTTVIDHSNITGTSYSYNGSDLSNNTIYYWRLSANNAFGTSAYSNVWSFTTLLVNITDIDGNVYNTVQIGTQIWLVQNLKTTRYRNGDAIPNVISGTSWGSLTTGAYCNYSNDSNNANIYGRLYNWFAVNNPQGLAPTGWHVATDNDWQILVDYIGGSSIAGTILKSTSGWNLGGNGTNAYGFTALPGGYRKDNGTFYNISNYGYWWSASEYNASNARGRYIRYDYAFVYLSNFDKKHGFSIRCVRD